MLFNDAGVSGEPVDVGVKQAYAAILCSLLGTVLDPIRGPAAFGVVAGESSARRLTTTAVEMLAKESGAQQRGHRVAAGPEPRPAHPGFQVGDGDVAGRISQSPAADRFTTLLIEGPGTCSMRRSPPASAATLSFTACSAHSGTERPANTLANEADLTAARS